MINIYNILTKEFLEEEYRNKKTPVEKIAKSLRCSKNTVLKCLNKFNIFRNQYVVTKAFLVKEYLENNLSVCQVAQKIGCSSAIISKYLTKFKINKKDPLEKILTKAYLQENYIDKKLTVEQIAKNLSCGVWPVRKYLLKYGIKIRSIQDYTRGRKRGSFSKEWREKLGKSKKGRKKSLETRIKMGKAHLGKKYRCRGVTSLTTLLYTSLEYRNWRDNIFQRDNYICQGLGCPQKGGGLEAHHIKKFLVLLKEFLSLYPTLDIKKNKNQLLILAKNYTPFWDITNGKTLCCKCHTLSHKEK